jgi:hypothetical protein
MAAIALMKRVVKIQMKCRVGTRLVKNHSLNANLAGMKIQTENLVAVAVVVDDERQMKSHKKPVARVVQPEGLHQAVQVGNADQPAVAAAEEKPAVVVMAKVGVGKLFLVLGRGVKTTKKVWNILVPKTKWLHQIIAITEMKMCSPKVGSTVFAMYRVGWRQLASSSPAIWIAANNRLKTKSL